MSPKSPRKHIPKLHFSEPIGTDRRAMGTICECGFREFTLTMVESRDERALWAQCITCKQSYRVTIYSKS